MRSLARWFDRLRSHLHLHPNDRLEVRSNLRIAARERGKLATSRDTHNIFLDIGRDWLAHLIALQAMPPYGSFAGPTSYFQPHRLVRYMCFGIGGNKQVYPTALFGQPPLNQYAASAAVWPPPFTQTDTDPGVYALEAPVILSSNGHALPPSDGWAWLGQIALPTFPGTSPGEVTFTRIFLEAELSEDPFDLVPLSEIGLFVDDPAPSYPTTMPVTPGSMIAYNTFNTISKTNAIALQVDWTFRF